MATEPISQEQAKFYQDSTKAIVSIVKSMVTVSEIDTKNLKPNKIESLSKNIEKFVIGINGVLEAMTNSKIFSKNSDDFQKTFIDATIYKLDGKAISKGEYDKISGDENLEKRLIKESQLTIPQMITSVATVLCKLSESVKAIGDIDMGKKGIAKTTINLAMMGDQMDGLMDAFNDMLKKIGKKDMTKVMSWLVSDPEQTINEFDTIKHGDNLTSNNKTTTIKGRVGFLDALTMFLQIIGSLSNVQPANILTFDLKLKLTMWQLNKVVAKIAGLGKDKQMIDDVAGAGKVIDTILETVSNFQPLFSAIGKLGTPATLKAIKNGNKALVALCGDEGDGFVTKTKGIGKWKKSKTDSSFLLKLWLAFADDSIITTLSKEKDEDIKKINDVLIIIKGISSLTQPLVEISKNLALVAVLAIPAIIGGLLAMVLLIEINWLMNEINWLELKVDNNAVESLNTLNTICENLKNVAINLSLLSLLAIPAFFGAIGAFFLLGIVEVIMTEINALSLVIEKEKVTENIEKINNVIKGLVWIGLSLSLLGMTMILLPLMIAGFLGTLIILLMLIPITKLINKLGSKSPKAMISLLLLSAFIAALAGDILLLALVGYLAVEYTKIIVGGFISLIVILVIVGLVMWGLSIMSPVLIAGAIALLLVAAAIGLLIMDVILMVAMVTILNMLKPETISGGMSNLKEMFVGKNGLVGTLNDMWHSMDLSTMLGGIIMMGSLIIMTTLLLLVCAELALIALLPEKLFEQAKINVKKIIETIDYIFVMLNSKPEGQDGDEDNKGVFGSLIGEISPGLGRFMDAIFAMAMLAISVIVVSCVLLIAGELALLGMINLDEGQITSNIETIIGSINHIYDKLNEPRDIKPKSAQGWFSKLISEVSPSLGGMMDAITSLPFLLTSMIVVSAVLLIGKELDTIAKLKLSDVNGQVDKLFESVNYIQTRLNNSKVPDENSNSKKMIKYLQNTSKDLNKIFQSFKIGGKFNKNHEKFVNNNIKLLDKVNSVDTTKIKTTTEMFEKMAKFSESIHGDFEKLADCLNEDILDAIKELNGYLSGENQSESMWDKAKGAVSSALGKTEGETVKEEKKAEQVAKTGKPDYSEITSRIDQLKNALRSLQTAVEETNNKNRW